MRATLSLGRLKKIGAAVVIAGCLGGCHTVEDYENPAGVEKLTGGHLCAEANVALANKGAHDGTLMFVIQAPEECLDRFASSLFPPSALATCDVDSRNACMKTSRNDQLTIYRSSLTSLEMHIW